MAFFAYGYFVKTPTGIFHAGHDFGPTLDSYKVGDSLGIKKGEKGIVIGILKGESAKRSGGYDVFVLHHLLWLLGKDWFNAEAAKAPEDRHVIVNWRDERNHQLRKYQDPKDPDGLVRARVTGGIRALQVFADDLYQLAHALEPPRQILARIRDPRQFQGARYEILAASLFARCGFEIEFI